VLAPVIPDDSLSLTAMRAAQVTTVEVGRVTGTVPPGATVLDRALLTSRQVVVFVTRREHHAIVRCQRITCRITQLLCNFIILIFTQPCVSKCQAEISL